MIIVGFLMLGSGTRGGCPGVGHGGGDDLIGPVADRQGVLVDEVDPVGQVARVAAPGAPR